MSTSIPQTPKLTLKPNIHSSSSITSPLSTPEVISTNDNPFHQPSRRRRTLPMSPKDTSSPQIIPNTGLPNSLTLPPWKTRTWNQTCPEYFPHIASPLKNPQHSKPSPNPTTPHHTAQTPRSPPPPTNNPPSTRQHPLSLRPGRRPPSTRRCKPNSSPTSTPPSTPPNPPTLNPSSTSPPSHPEISQFPSPYPSFSSSSSSSPPSPNQKHQVPNPIKQRKYEDEPNWKEEKDINSYSYSTSPAPVSVPAPPSPSIPPSPTLHPSRIFNAHHPDPTSPNAIFLVPRPGNIQIIPYLIYILEALSWVLVCMFSLAVLLLMDWTEIFSRVMGQRSIGTNILGFVHQGLHALCNILC